jgi:hypothetical protein
MIWILFSLAPHVMNPAWIARDSEALRSWLQEKFVVYLRYAGYKKRLRKTRKAPLPRLASNEEEKYRKLPSLVTNYEQPLLLDCIGQPQGANRDI